MRAAGLGGGTRRADGGWHDGAEAAAPKGIKEPKGVKEPKEVKDEEFQGALK